MKKNHFPLAQISQIHLGLHAEPVETGLVTYLQANQFDNLGRFIEGRSLFLDYNPTSSPYLLQAGDVIMAGKGNRNFAWCYHIGFGLAIASSIFFVIRPLKEVIDSEYLTAILNLPQNQLHFRRLSSGTDIPSIRKSELEAFKIPVVSMEQQQKVVEVNKYHLLERALTEKLIDEQDDLHKAIISKIINSNHV